MFELNKGGKTCVCGVSQQIIEVGEQRITVEGKKSSRGRSTTSSFKILEFFNASRIVKSQNGSFLFRYPIKPQSSEFEEVELLDFSDEIIVALRGCILKSDEIPGVSSLNSVEKSEVLQLLFDDQPKTCALPRSGKRKTSGSNNKVVFQNGNSSDFGDEKSDGEDEEEYEEESQDEEYEEESSDEENFKRKQKTIAKQKIYGKVNKTQDRKSTRLNSSHEIPSRMPSSA
eukprot:TRINITY_DN7828_c0_g2_i1.p1 TRINITY_DN7828_c0_g2~~TRINITY_DN7828_c0_g2_i1.p1  ORF type:complete len:229 (+),score=50.43 TRINITY_DN7828_c0_g2_i1:1427-2113(+)